MPELKRNFIRGRMNKDLDERLVPNGEYRDALNVEVLTSEGSNIGSLQTSRGNSKLSEITLPGQECVGSIADEKNNKIYWFIAGDSFSIKPYPNNNIHEVHQDAILEYDIATDTVTPVLVDNYTVQTTLYPGTSIGTYGLDPEFLPVKTYQGLRPGMKLKAYDSSGSLLNPPFYGIPGQHSIPGYVVPNQELIVIAIPSALGPSGLDIHLNLDIDVPTGEEDKLNLVFESPRALNFDKSRMITGINILDGMLFWTDNNSEPKKINIARCKEGNAHYLQPFNRPDNGLNSTALIVGGVPQKINWMQGVSINQPWGYPKIISEEDITVIKKSPTAPPTLTLNNWIGKDSNFNGNFVLNPLYDEAGTQIGTVGDPPESIIVGDRKSIILSNSNIRYQIGTTLLIQQAALNNGVVSESNYNVKAKVVSGTATIITPAVTTSVTTVSSAEAPPYTHWYTSAPLGYAISILVDPPNAAIQAGQLVTATDPNGNPLENLFTGAPPEIFVDTVVQFGPGTGQLVMLTGSNIGWQSGSTTYAGTILPGTYTNLEFWDYTPPITVSDNHWLKILEIGGITTNDNETWNIIENPNDKLFEFKFPRFAYRYQYEDGEYSAMSPFSEVAFLPHENGFDYHSKKGYNLGMTNGLTNVVVGSWNPKNKPLGVKEIQVLYKESNSPNVYAIQSFVKNDWEWNQSIYAKGVDSKNDGYLSINSKMIHHAIESNQLLRPWDGVPRKALAQEITGNRLVYGNYLQNYNQEVDNIGFELSVQSYPITGISSRTGNSTALKSLKSFREYQVGVIYRDEYGREMPVLSTSSSLVKIQKDFSRYANVLEAKISHSAPSWATSFKYFVKETSNQYYNLAIDRYYNAADESIWLSFPSEDRNKIDDETTIILKKGHDEDRDIRVPQERFKILSIKNEAPEFIKTARQSLGTLQTGTQQSITSGSFFKSPGGNVGIPLNGINYFYLDIEDHLGGTNNDIPIPGWEGSPFAYLQKRTNDGVFENRLTTDVAYQVRFKTSLTVSGLEGKTKWYDIASITYSSVNEMEIHTGENFEDDIDILLVDPDADPHTGTIRSGIQIEIARLTKINRAEFEGRFFAKVHKSSVITKHILKTSTEEDVVVRSQATHYGGSQNTTDGDSNPEGSPRYILRYKPEDYTAGQFQYIANAPKIVGIVEENANGQNEATYFNGPGTSSYTDYQMNFDLWKGVGVDDGIQTSDIAAFPGFVLGTGSSGSATLPTRHAPGSGVWITKWQSSTTLGTGTGGYDYCVPWKPGGDWRDNKIGAFGNIESRIIPEDASLDDIKVKGFWFIDQESTYQVLSGDDKKYQHVKNTWATNDQDNSGFGVAPVTTNNVTTYSHWEVFSDTGIGAVVGSTQMDVSFTSWAMDPTDEDAFNDPGRWDLVRDCPKAKPMVDQLQPGKKFRWAEDPDDNIYTILMVEKSYHFNYGLHPQHETTSPNWRSAHNDCHHHRKRARFRLTLDKPIAPDANSYVPTNPPNTSGGGRKGEGPASFGSGNIRATMIFLENRLDNYVEMASNPAIFETEPKEDLGLDIYHEVGQAFPIKITADTANQYIKPGATLPYTTGKDPKKFTRAFALIDGSQPSLLTYYPNGPGRAGNILFMESNSDIEIGMAAFGSVYENNDPSGNILQNVLLGAVIELDVGNTYLNYERVKISEHFYAPTYTNANMIMTRKMPVPGTDITFTNLPVVKKVAAEVGPIEKNGSTKSVKITTSIPLSTTYLQSLPIVGDTLTFKNPDGYEVTTTITETNQAPFDEIYVSPVAHGQTQQLQYSNCYSFGNGVESNRIKDLFNEVFIDKGVKASTTIELSFEEDRRSNSLIFSGIYNSVSETNNLNQFIIAEGITKSLSPTYGSLQKLHSRDTDLIALCEDKILKILANKDALFNADDTRNITANPNVLGQTMPFIGEYGISKNPESFVSREFRAYFTDIQRGAVMRLSRDGLTPISEHGMKGWFRDNLSNLSKVVKVTGIEYVGGADDGRYFFFEESEMHSLLNRTDWSATGVGNTGTNPEKVVEMKQYRNNTLIYSGLMMLWDNNQGAATNSPSGGPTKGFGRRTMPDGSWGTASNIGDFQVGDIITIEIRDPYIPPLKVIGSYDSRKSLYNVSIKRDSASPVVTEELGPELIANGDLNDSTEWWSLDNNWEYLSNTLYAINAGAEVDKVVQSLVSIKNWKNYRLTFTISDYQNGKVRAILYGNGYHAISTPSTGFDADGTYTQDFFIDSLLGSQYVQYNNTVTFQPYSSAFTGKISNISVREITEIKTNPNNKTVSFSETAKGWVSFKSYIPESGLSINSEYYTFKNGDIWQHHSNNTRNNFYGIQYDSSLNVLFNELPGSVKTFSALNYTGSQSKISANLKDNNHYNLAEKEGWYVKSLATDMQEGKVKDFKEKEGKWFNHIQGLETTINNLDTKEFSVQGIGKPSSVG